MTYEQGGVLISVLAGAMFSWGYAFWRDGDRKTALVFGVLGFVLVCTAYVFVKFL